MKDCRKLKAYNEKQNTSSTNMIQQEQSEEEEDYLLSIDENQGQKYNFLSNKTEWILDSGATAHTVSDKRLFNKIESTADKQVKLADDKRINISGKGT